MLFFIGIEIGCCNLFHSGCEVILSAEHDSTEKDGEENILCEIIMDPVMVFL